MLRFPDFSRFQSRSLRLATMKRTISPETILREANLLPSNHKNPEELLSSANSSVEGTLYGSLASGPNTTHLRRTDADAPLIDTKLDSDGGTALWDWKRVDTERVRGLQKANLLTGLDDLHLEFTGAIQPAIGR